MSDRRRDGSGHSGSSGSDAGGDQGAPRRHDGGSPADPPVTAEDLGRIRRLIRQLEDDIPESYRAAVLRFLLPRVWEDGGVPSGRPLARIPREDAAPGRRELDTAASRLEARPIDIAPFSELLAQPGKNLLKALAALEVARTQLDVEWMTPSEIERFLTERAGLSSIYRTNLSNALRSAREGADRRRRGRGYEYRITDRGRTLLRRELEILGP